jgi:hypothetical protein
MTKRGERCPPTRAPTYMQRGGALICTTCGAVVGSTEADQIRHMDWHATL